MRVFEPRIGRVILRRLAGRLLWVILATLAPGSTASSARYALLIGIDEYESPVVSELRYAEADAEALKKTLEEKCGFDEVMLLTSDTATRTTIIKRIYDIASRIPDENNEDTFLLYFAGHGVRNRAGNEKTYWFTYRSGLTHPDVEGIRLEHLADFLTDVKAKYKLLILDHCFSGDIVTVSLGENLEADSRAGPRDPEGGEDIPAVTFERNVSLSMSTVDETQLRTVRDRGITLLAASVNEAQELESLEHGLFTSVLLQALGTSAADEEPRDGKLRLGELIRYLKREVASVASAQGVSQEVRTYSAGSDTDWIVVDEIPGDQSLTADRYSDILVAWYGNGWITPETQIRCSRAIRHLKNDEMDEEDSRIVAEIRAYTSRTPSPEDDDDSALAFEEIFGSLIR